MKYLCRRQHLLSISICWIVWKLFDHINKIRISDEKTFSFGPGKVFHDRESETWVYWGDLSVSAPVSWLFHNDQSSLDDGSFAPCLLQHHPPSVEAGEAGEGCPPVWWWQCGGPLPAEPASQSCSCHWLSVQLEMSMRPSDLRQQQHGSDSHSDTLPSPAFTNCWWTCFSQVSYGSRRRCVICVY